MVEIFFEKAKNINVERTVSGKVTVHRLMYWLAKYFNRRIEGDNFLKCIARQETKIKQHGYFTTKGMKG